MVIEIEYYKGDTLLYGPQISFEKFKEQIETVETLYDKKEDNFIALLHRMYHWTVIEEKIQPQYIYDRDIKKCINIH